MKKYFLWVLFITTCLRLLLAKIVPITGDEAYFITWAKHLDYGYYEHPPMIGWIMWLFSFLGQDIFVYRLFPVLSIPIMAIIFVKLLVDFDRDKAFLCATTFLLSPVCILNVLSVNDAPLIFFSFLAGIFFYIGLKRNKLGYAAVAGFLWSCAFLSKYFAVLLAVAVLIFCFAAKNRKIWKFAGIAALFSLPFVILNIVWNYNHCWTNLTFNLFFRNKNITFNFLSVFVYIIEQFFLMTPYLAFIFLKRKFLWHECKSNHLEIFWFFFMVPLLFFFCLSFLKDVGLHWMASFYPFFFIPVILLPSGIINKATRYNVYLVTAIVIPVIVLLCLPTTVFYRIEKYPQLIMFLKPEKLCNEINNMLDNRILAATGYTEASVFSYHCKKNFVLLGSMSKSGRYYDFITDFRNFDGRNFLIVSLNKTDIQKFADYFEKIEVKQINVYGADFFIILGEHFIYRQYRDIYLSKILKKYYTVPAFLPTRRNFFAEKYFPELSFSK